MAKQTVGIGSAANDGTVILCVMAQIRLMITSTKSTMRWGTALH